MVDRPGLIEAALKRARDVDRLLSGRSPVVAVEIGTYARLRKALESGQCSGVKCASKGLMDCRAKLDRDFEVLEEQSYRKLTHVVDMVGSVITVGILVRQKDCVHFIARGDLKNLVINYWVDGDQRQVPETVNRRMLVGDWKSFFCARMGLEDCFNVFDSECALDQAKAIMHAVRSSSCHLFLRPVKGETREAVTPVQGVVNWEDFTEICALRKGEQSSEILKLCHKRTAQVVVAKIISTAGVGTQQIRREFELLQSFRACAQIIPFIGVAYVPERPDVIAIITEFAEGGNLEDALKTKILSLPQISQILQDVLIGLQALHTAGVIHRDIKPSNILLNKQRDHAFLCDLGASRLVETGVTQTVLCTEGYVAEEARRGKAQLASDVFSFGVVLREAVTGTKSAEAESPWLAVRDGKFDTRDVANPVVASLILDCVRRNPAARPRIDVVLERFKSIEPGSLVAKKAESTGIRTIRFQEGDDPAVCAFEAKDSHTVAEAMEEAGLEGRLYDQKGFAIAFRMRIGKLDPSVIYILR